MKPVTKLTKIVTIYTNLITGGIAYEYLGVFYPFSAHNRGIAKEIVGDCRRYHRTSDLSQYKKTGMRYIFEADAPELDDLPSIKYPTIGTKVRIIKKGLKSTDKVGYYRGAGYVELLNGRKNFYTCSSFKVL